MQPVAPVPHVCRPLPTHTRAGRAVERVIAPLVRLVLIVALLASLLATRPMTLVVSTTQVVPVYFTVNGFGNQLIDAAGEKAAWLLQAPKDGTIDRLGFRTGTVTTSSTLLVRMESMAADGSASGNLFAAGTEGTQGALTSNTSYEITLGTGAVVVESDYFWVVIVQPAVSPGNCNIVNYNVPVAGTLGSMMTALYTTSWSRSQAQAVGTVRYSDGSYPYIYGLWPLTAASSDTLSDSTNPDEIGIKFVSPIDCKVSYAWYGIGAAGADVTLKVYDSADNVLATGVHDGDAGQVTNSARIVKLSDEVTLDAGSTYRITVRANTATSMTIRNFSWTSTYAAQVPGNEWGAHKTTRNNDGGAWTDTAGTRPAVGLQLSALDAGAGGGGGFVSAERGVPRGVA